MNYNNLKLFIPYDNIMILSRLSNGKNVCLSYLGENTTLLENVNNLNINKVFVKFVFLPNTIAPLRTYMTTDYRRYVLDNKLKPIKGNFEDINVLKGKNFYIDSNYYIDKAIDRWKLHNLRSFRAAFIYNNYFKGLNYINSDAYEKVLLYNIDISKPFNENFNNKKITPIFLMLSNYFKKGTEFPFDKILFCIQNNDSVEYRLVFDKSSDRNNLLRIRKIIFAIKNEKLDDMDTMSDDDIQLDDSDFYDDDDISNEEYDNLLKFNHNYDIRESHNIIQNYINNKING